MNENLPEEPDEELKRLCAEAQKEAGTFPTRKEMISLNIRRLQGDEKAREEMIVRNMPLVRWYIARKHDVGNPNFDDDLQEGFIGLMKAVEKFDHTIGASFGTYALWWIRQCVFRSFQNKHHTIRLPVHVRTTLKKLREKIAALEKRLGYEPNLEEISAETGFSIERLTNLLQAPTGTESLDAPYAEDSTLTYHDRVLGEKERSPSELLECREEFLEMTKTILRVCEILEKNCSAKEGHHKWPKILYQRLGICGFPSEGATLEEVGRQHGVTRERIRQICEKIPKRLEIRKLVPGGYDAIELLVQHARQAMQLAFEDPNAIPERIMWLLGEAEPDESRDSDADPKEDDRLIA